MKEKYIYCIGGVEYISIYQGLIPETSEEEYQRLKEDITENGVQLPILIDENWNIIDGEQRAKAASELEHKDIPVRLYHGSDKKDKMDTRIRLNAHRRQWSREERLRLAVTLRKNKYSLRRIASILNISHETIRRYIEKVKNKEDFPDIVEGSDGIERPARQKKRPCVIFKNSQEVKKGFQELHSDGVKGLTLPEKTIDAKGLGRYIRKHRAENTKADSTDITIGNAELWCGDFRELADRIEPETVDMILTDPPYAKEYIPIWSDLAKVAERILKPGGLLLSYSGMMYLPEVHKALSEHLQYFWTFAIRHKGGHQTVYPVNVTQMWKPVLGYCKPPFNKTWKPFPDMVSGGQSKDFHDWEQPEEEASYFIEKLCPKSGLLVDPMMGSGTVILSAMQQGCQCIGMDIDSTAHSMTSKRVTHLQEHMQKKAA